tara:strand:- start:156 stop:650 length:495 start_codon:yes stop_codon:yes gene_type:complete
MTTAIKGNDTSTFGGAIAANNVSAIVPAFSASKTDANQSIVTATNTKITFNNELFDTASNFASSRFTPTVAGYYQLNANIYFLVPVDQSLIQISITKNGSVINYGNITTASGTTSIALHASALVEANGTTDYFEVYCYHNNGSNKEIDNLGSATYFNGVLARAA